MTAEELHTTVLRFCEDNANEANVIKYSRFFKGGNIVSYGLTAPQIHGFVKDMLKVKKVSFDAVLKASTELIRSEMSEHLTIAMLLINGFGKQYTKSLFHEINHWYTFTIHNWAHADTLGMMILPQFLKYNVITYQDFGPWITSAYSFQRRSVPVTLIKLLKSKKVDDFNPIFTFLKPLMSDPEREVHQGMGWFLREAWKLKPDQAEAFLLKWKDKAPRLIINYATEKMSKEDKLRFKKG